MKIIHMKTSGILLLLISLAITAKAQWAPANTPTYKRIYRSGNVAIGTSDSSKSKLYLVHNNAYIGLLPESTGIGNLMQIGRPQGLSLGITSYGSEQQKLITRIGINYAIDGGDGLIQYAVIGTKKAPVIEFDAEQGAINLYGENGTGTNFRHSTATMNLGLNVASNGNVGIGVTAGVQEKLVVYNNNSQTKVLIGNPNSSTGQFTSLTLGTSANTNGYTFLQAIKSAGSAMGDISLNHMGGNVGIGTTAPDGLQVNSILSQETSRGVSNVRLGLFGNTPRIIFDYAGYTPFEIDNVQDKFRIFTPGQEMLVIKANGNIGIGSTNPDAKLTVKGNIHTEEVIVDMLVPGPDYVFEKDYNLLSLSELEAYISQNKHLPEVPSAKEMEADGLNLKEMNLLLLKKVEELTLHLIDANKKIESLDKQVQSLSELKDIVQNADYSKRK